MAFSYSIKPKKNYRLLSLEGNLLSAFDGKQLLEELNIHDAASAMLVIDLGKMQFLNSEGFNVLLKILTASRNHDGEVIVMHVSGALKELFIITKLNAVFTLAPTLKEAENLLAKVAG
jgi:anti-anti-sigma factor